MSRSWRQLVVRLLGVALSLFVLAEVNYPHLRPQSQLALFALLGLVICFLTCPASGRRTAGAAQAEEQPRLLAGLDVALAALSAACCLYVVVQTEPLFTRFWLAGSSLGDRAGAEVALDYAVGVAGLLLVLEATRRAVGWALPILAGSFLLYALFGPHLPGWLFPHRGYSIERIVSQTFLHSQGVFGTALQVMFTYVFLFVLFGALLEITGATRFIIDAAQRLFRGRVGGPAKVSVLSSGLMGSLSGSAVANTATTGTFTIPLMRSAGFRPHVAAGVEAAASSGGALVPPVMGAGAYMMLEIIDPPVTYLQIVKAAFWPAMLYYLSLLLIVHFYALRLHRAEPAAAPDSGAEPAGAAREVAAGTPRRWEGLLFFSALAALVVLLLFGYTVFRSVSLALGLIFVLAACNRRTRIGPAGLLAATARAAAGSVSLICAASCVGVVIGVVTLTGIGTKLPATILPLAQESLLLALALIMVSSIILGMGLPSAVCYLLMATLIGPVLGKLGVVPLAAHLFIFYFGMMSMVTPPVALAAYTAGSIAAANIMASGFAAFRFALVGFTLPYMFVFRPELLLLAPGGEPAPLGRTFLALLLAVAGIVPLAAGIAGYLFGPLGAAMRAILLVAAGLLLFPSGGIVNGAGLAMLAVAAAADWRRTRVKGW